MIHVESTMKVKWREKVLFSSIPIAHGYTWDWGSSMNNIRWLVHCFAMEWQLVQVLFLAFAPWLLGCIAVLLEFGIHHHITDPLVFTHWSLPMCLCVCIQPNLWKENLWSDQCLTASLPGEPARLLPDCRTRVLCDGLLPWRRPHDAHSQQHLQWETDPVSTQKSP